VRLTHSNKELLTYLLTYFNALLGSLVLSVHKTSVIDCMFKIFCRHYLYVFSTS